MVGALLAAAFAVDAAEPDFRDWLVHDWHDIEIVVFLHRTVETREEIVRVDPRRVPLPLTAFDAPSSEWRWPLDDVAPAEGAVPAETTVPAEDLPFPPAWLWMDDPALISIPDLLAPGTERPPENAGDTAQPEAPTPAPIAPSPSRATVRQAFGALEEALLRASMQWRLDGLALTSVVTRMQRSPGYEVLHHARWLQALRSPSRAVPVLLELGPEQPNGLHRIEGTLRVSRGLFVEIDARVWLHDEARGYAELSETRRMRAGDVHYLDHPRIGLVVRAQRLKVPQALAELVKRLHEGR